MTSVRRGRPRTDALRQKSVRVLEVSGFCSTWAAEDGRAPAEELACVRGVGLLFDGGRPRTRFRPHISLSHRILKSDLSLRLELNGSSMKRLL
jgi:hypothetical protein